MSLDKGTPDFENHGLKAVLPDSVEKITSQNQQLSFELERISRLPFPDSGRTGGGVIIFVKDNGSDISDSIKDKIFQPFFTTKPTGQGTGLGLSLNYDIVKAHTGKISINSKEEKEQNLKSYFQYRLGVMFTLLRILPELKFFLPLLFLGACTGTPQDDGTTPAPLFQPAPRFKANPPGGYVINPISGDSIQPILNFEGDTLKTGVFIPAKGKIIHPDSVSRPKTVAGPPKGQLPKKPFLQSRYIVPGKLTVIPVDERKLTSVQVPQVLESDTTHFIINSIGARIASGRSIPIKGKTVPAIQPQPSEALLPQMKDAANTNLQYLDVEQGMASSNVMSIEVDRLGNLWFGSWDGGVSKYDGVGFTLFTKKEGLSENTVWSILEDRNGNLWFGTNGGINKYDGVDFTHFTEKEGLTSDKIISIEEDRNGNIWFGTNGGGVSKYNGEGFTNYTEKEGLSSNIVNSIEEDSRGNIWFGTEGGGVSKYDGEGFTHFTENDGLSSNIVSSIVEDHNGNLWFGTDGGGVSKYDGKGFTHYSEMEGLINNMVVSIEVDRVGNLWFGTEGGGVSKYNGEGFTHFTDEEGLSSNRIVSIAVDNIGNLWFGTDGGGVSKYNGEGFTHYSEKEGLSSNRVRHVNEDSRGNLWFSTDGSGVSKYDGEGLTHYTEKEGLSSNRIWSMVEDRTGNLWFGTTDNGVSKYDGEGFTHYTEKEGLSSNIVWSILEDHFGNIWIGTAGGGVSKYDGIGFTHFTEKEGLSNNRVLSIVEDRTGNLWFGTWGGGVSKYDGKGFTHYTEREGLSNNVVWSIVEDRSGNLWFGTDGGGVSKYDGEFFTHYTQKEGLSSNIVRSIVENRNASNGIEIYLGTEKGITKMNISSPNNSDVEVGSIQVLEKQDGLKGLDGLFSSAEIDSKNRAWWGMGKSLTMLDLNNQHQQAQSPPAVYLRQLAINGQFIDYRNLPNKLENEIKFKEVKPFENYPLFLEVPYNKKHLTFHFSAIDWSAPHKIRYSYRMLGLDDLWSIPISEPKADYRNLPFGTFIFQLRAIGESGEWSEAFEYTFTIRPPWWHSWWAYGLYTVIVGAGILSIDRFQRRRLIEKEQEKAREKELEREKEHTRELEIAYDELEDSLEKLTSTQAQLIQSEKMASLGQLTAGIAHEIQNPLNFVNNFSQVNKELLLDMQVEILKGNHDVVKAITNDLIENEEKIILHGKRVDAIVKGMLEHSKRGTGKKELTDLNALTEEITQLSYDSFLAKNQKFRCDYLFDLDPKLPKLELIPQDIAKALLNLLNNAFYACGNQPSGGEKPTVIVSTKKLRNTIEISIRDNGPGIPDSIKDKIFQPFFTTKPTGHGTGLGLSLSYDIVKAHGGVIKVETKEGNGTEFIVQLPIS